MKGMRSTSTVSPAELRMTERTHSDAGSRWRRSCQMSRGVKTSAVRGRPRITRSGMRAFNRFASYTGTAPQSEVVRRICAIGMKNGDQTATSPASIGIYVSASDQGSPPRFMGTVEIFTWR